MNTIPIIAHTVLGIILLILYIINRDKERSLVLLISTWVCFIIMHMYIIRNQTISKIEGPKVDLPEEYETISNDPLKPDTILGFYDNDTLYITFKPKNK